MIARLPNEAITDILHAIRTLTAITAKHDLGTFSKNQQLRWAVERGLQIISEAARNIPAALTDRHPKVPWADIRGMGNILRHDYMEISQTELWKTVRQDLKPLQKACESLHRTTISPPPSTKKK